MKILRPTFRVLDDDDIPFGLTLCRQAGWNQLDADWRRFLALEPQGCFLASHADRPVGTVTTCRMGTLGWIGMLLVEKSCRGQGVGTALLFKAVEWLRAQGIATIRLDASEMGKPLYEKHGFETRYRVLRLVGRAPVVDTSAACEPISVDEVLRLDRATLGVPRDPLLRALCAETAAVGIRARGIWRGYALMREGAVARQLGPVVARDAPSAQTLIAAQCRAAGARDLFLDVPEPNEAACRHVESLGLLHARTFWRMDLGPAPDEVLTDYWACSGPEKG
jgi:GNAT superfamily N-acetyltransferase